MIEEEFRRRRTRQWVAAVPGLVAFFALLVAADNSDSEQLFGLPAGVVFWIAIAVFAAYALFSFANWRCPSCSRYLGRAINPTFCVKCGTRLKP